MQTTKHDTICDAWWWKQHVLGLFLFQGTGKLMKIKGIIRKELYLNIIDENVWWSAKEINLA